MVFAAILILIVLLVGYFHFLQGFFSSALSAIFAVTAAVFAFSYHESIVENLLGGKMADSANAMVLLILFAVIYLVLRVLADNLIPGNVRLPATVDKSGAAVCGLIAGLFAAGIVAIAAQELPFGVSIAGYTRYDINGDRDVIVPTKGRGIDSKIWDELQTHNAGEFGPEGSQHGVLPLISMDDIVIGTVNHLSSDTGSLSTGKPLASIHPDYLEELFGQRLGMELGTSRVAMNLPKRQQSMKVSGVFDLPANVAQADGELAKLRDGGPLKPITLTRDQMFLVVRAIFGRDAEDKQDSLMHFSTGAVRLVADVARKGEEPQYEDFFPVGTLDDANKLYLNKLDDFLLLNLKDKDRGVDFVFKVPKRVFEAKMPPGSFLEVKRLARADLSGDPVKTPITPDANVQVLRKTLVANPPAQVATGNSAPPPPPSNTAPPPPPAPTTPQQQAAGSGAFQFQSAKQSDQLPAPIAVAAGTENKGFAAVSGGTAGFKEGKVSTSLNVDTTAAEQNGPVKVAQFAIPDGMAMVQVDGAPAPSAPWAVATEPEQYELVDGAGKKFQPNGVFVRYPGKGGDRFNIHYTSNNTISGFAQPEGAGAPTQVTFLYLVPTGTTFQRFDDHGKQAGTVSVTTK